MIHYLNSKIGRLRLIGFLEGISLLFLLFIAVPAKYVYGNPALVRSIGMVHGLLFLLFVFNTLSVGVEQRWVFKTITLKVLVACIIPFGTFYIDWKILSRINKEEV
jgi:integral membrane protein